jgi:hypothetical protein
MTYSEPVPVSREEFKTALDTGDGLTIAKALVGLAFHSPDWQWVQDTCLALLDHDDLGVRAAAITCLGHLARIHHQLDTSRVLPRLLVLVDDPDLGGRVEDALDDIQAAVGTA